MRILHAIPTYAPAWGFGGPVLSVSRLCEALAKEGVDVEVITTNAGLPDLPKEQIGQPIFRNGVRVIYYPVNSPGRIIRSDAMEKALPDVMARVDLLHISAIWQPLGIPIQKSALDHNVPVLHTLRGALGPYSWNQGWWKKYPYFLISEKPLLQKAKGLHLTSMQEQRELYGLGLRAKKWVLPNPMDLSEMSPDTALGIQWRRQLGLSEQKPVLLICGRQHHKKGLDLLPPVLAELRNQSWQLLLVGSDEDGSGARLIEKLNRLQLPQKIIRIDTLPAPDLKGVYNASDLLLLPSRHENFGNVVVEALACACAIAISDKTGVGDTLSKYAPSSFGAVLPRRADMWAAWLKQWLSSPARAGLEVANWTRNNYGQQEVARKAIEIYREILQTNNARN